MIGRFDEEWVSEAERLHQRYLIEIVEAYDLCPWAQRARLGGQTRVAVLLAGEDDLVAQSLDALDGWNDDGIRIGFLVFPRVKLGRVEFNRFVAHLRSVDTDRCAIGSAPFALAAFHPDAEPDLADPERLVPFLRRTPDPCVQAVRMSALERVRRGTPGGTQFIDVASLEASLKAEAVTPPLRERIARANLDTVRREGVPAMRARFEAIQSDRAQTYRALSEREAR